MMLRRTSVMIVLALAAAGLPGCDKAQALFQSKADRINAAFPVSEELLAAQAAFFQSVKDHPGAKGLQDQFAQMQEVRALQCTSTVVIGRLDTAADIKQKVGDPTCFRGQDGKVLDWIGVKRFAVAVVKPPLVAQAPIAAATALPAQSEPTVSLVLASGANVAVLRGQQGKLTAIEIPSGKTLNSFAAPGNFLTDGALSPNGRVLAMPLGSTSLKMVDVETGNTLWNTDRYGGVLAWLPDIHAMLLVPRRGGAAAVVDLLNATIKPYTIPVQRVTWALSPAGQPSRLVIGDAMNVAVVDHSRASDGAIVATVAKQHRLASHAMGGYGGPMLMGNGRKLVFQSSQQIGWLDLESGAQGSWSTRKLNVSGVAPISANGLLLQIAANAELSGDRLLDIEQGTLSPIKPLGDFAGRLRPLASRTGYMKSSGDSVIIGSAVVPEGEAVSMDKIVADLELAEQLAKLAQPMPGPQTHVAVNPWPQGGPGASTATAAAIPGVPANAHVSAIGVYEPHVRATGGQGPGPIDVSLVPGRTPLVLVLTSYAGVQWNIRTYGRPLAAVLLSSYEPSTVTGYQGNVVRIGRSYAYKVNSAEYNKLRAEVAQYVPQPIRLFQGAYSGKEFSVPAD